MKTVPWTICFLLFWGATPLGGQISPLQWPVPPPGAPHDPSLPRLLIPAAEAAVLLKAGDAVPLDARGTGPFEAGHLPGGVPVWSLQEEDEENADRVGPLLAARGITGKETVILYGDPGRETVARLFWLLRRAGCPEVRIFEGGLAAWRAAGGTLERGPSRRSPSEVALISGGSAADVDADWVASSLGQPGVEILDVRDARGWDLWQTPPIFAAGHIPRSLPFDPRALLPSDGGWPDPTEIRRRLSTLGPRPGDPVRLESTFIVYGKDARDPRVGLAYLLFTFAGLEVRVFPGGWREWTQEQRRPIVRIVSAAELAALLEREGHDLGRDDPPRRSILIDLREERDYALGHLPGSLNLPYLVFTQRFEKQVEEGWPGADRATIPLVLYCYGPECIRSRDAGAFAARRGFRDVLWFRGGVREWWEAEYPLLDSPLARALPATP